MQKALFRFPRRNARRFRRPGLMAGLAAVLAVSVAACSSAGAQEEPVSEATATNTASEPAPVPAGALPDTPAGLQAQWVLTLINAGTPVATDGFPDKFADVILSELSAEQLAEVLEQVRSQGPWTPIAVNATDTQGVFTLESKPDDLTDLQLSVDEAGMINGIFFGPGTPARTPAASWEEVKTSAAALPDGSALAVYRVADGTAVLDINADTAKPLGSIFKLYVLVAVTDAVAAGTLSWDTALTVTDDLRSLPSGELQDAPAGTTVTVRDAAQKMISISDNTATDLLMDAVGRPAVEQALSDAGHADPDRNTPFLSTRELFRLGWGVADSVRGQWADAGDDGRRALLQTLPGGVLDIPATAVSTPVWQQDLDWFATAEDLMRVHLALQERAATDAGASLRDILGANNGLSLEIGGDWTYIGFKGGSAPGVMAGSWYLERSDGERFVVVQQGASSSPAEVADPRTFFGPAQDAIALLAAEGKR
ncbi:serine hydrolase [Arthrobacter sp. APC 3897]|uniref:serine hydrolase n=1 Tax=Arthrobacter sp. APC 3897 TaxID=3035204 RepID=UPI0025B60DF4|nr:serine hydrolase [Arthrobacter sp. APC 3897]MDN3480725.1 serine hydrolase [Arthrobacter sp. APC 3897]